MRHRKFSQRLSRPGGHRRATLRNLIVALLRYQQIKTTKAKAKFAQSFLERLISLGKQNTLHSRRLAFKILDNKSAVSELFSRIAPLFKNKTSGFSRIIHLSSNRSGDGAEMVLWELTEKLPKVKSTKPTPEPAEPKIHHPEEKGQFPKARPKPSEAPKPKKFLGGLRGLFKKERDSL